LSRAAAPSQFDREWSAVAQLSLRPKAVGLPTDPDGNGPVPGPVEHDGLFFARVSFSSPGMLRILSRTCDFCDAFSRGCVRRSASHAASHGLIWPEDGCASIA
jgi:hypothetical protein